MKSKKYLNNIIKQDPQGIKRLFKLGMGFASFNTAQRTIKGYEAMNIVRKRQIQRVARMSRQRTGFLHQPNLWSGCIEELFSKELL